jgi:hypothetical protein
MENKNFFTTTPGILLIILFLLACCCLVLVGLGLGGLLYLGSQAETQNGDFTFEPTSMPVMPVRPQGQEIPLITLQTLQTSIVPASNPADLACRLEGKCNIPLTMPSGPYAVGAEQQFWAMDTDTVTPFQVNARLVYLTPNAYFWVQEGVSVNEKKVKALVDAFSEKMYPTNREFFGSEQSPGIDEDPRIYILYTRGIGSSVAGYFSSPDSYHPLAAEYSNAHEMFVFNADNSPLDDPYTFGVLAHEFQHMIHFAQDRNEATWVNEGFSELAVLLNGYYESYADDSYISNTDVQLTDWGTETGSNGPHYGSSFLFMTYFLDRFGEEATKQLVREPANDMAGVDVTLQAIGATDSQTGQAIRADDVFMDWAVANYLQDGSVEDGRYAYRNYPQAPQARPTDEMENCPTERNASVKQYGVDYLRIACRGQVTLTFTGSTLADLLPADAYSGSFAFWSNKGDESDMTLTRAFDFTNHTGALTLNYQTWYDIEEDYDYVYLEASTDGGKTWQMLMTPSGTGEDPSGNSYGWGYNGTSGGWVQESLSLDDFAGKKVLLRFEYVTDAAVNGEGLLLDDISIPEVNYFTDFETDAGGWESAGFVRVENALPQTFRLALIRFGEETKVETLPLTADQTAEVTLNFDDMEEAVLVISGNTRFTRAEAAYNVSVR